MVRCPAVNGFEKFHNLVEVWISSVSQTERLQMLLRPIGTPKKDLIGRCSEFPLRSDGLSQPHGSTVSRYADSVLVTPPCEGDMVQKHKDVGPSQLMKIADPWKVVGLVNGSTDFGCLAQGLLTSSDAQRPFQSLQWRGYETRSVRGEHRFGIFAGAERGSPPTELALPHSWPRPHWKS